jgi:hypothetical protein
MMRAHRLEERLPMLSRLKSLLPAALRLVGLLNLPGNSVIGGGSALPAGVAAPSPRCNSSWPPPPCRCWFGFMAPV